MRRMPLTRLCTAIPIALTPERSLPTICASRRFDRVTFPDKNHQSIFGFQDLGAATRTCAAAQLSDEAVNPGENNLPRSCCARIPTSSLDAALFIQLASGSNSSGPERINPACSPRRLDSRSCSACRCAESRRVTVGNRVPAKESADKERLSRNQLTGHVRRLKSRSMPGSFDSALISAGLLTSTRFTIPRTRSIFNQPPPLAFSLAGRFAPSQTKRVYGVARLDVKQRSNP